jgi:hypothetical protein
MIQEEDMMRWSGWTVMVSLLAACAPGEPDPEGMALPSGRGDPGEGTIAAGVIELPRGRAPVVDGIISPGEWDDAAMVEIAVEPGWEVPVRVKHDGHALYVAFANLKPGEAERYPEVLLAVRGTRDGAWTTNDWWLHASYQDCEGQGVFNNYQCSPTKPGWEANNFPLDPPGAIEFRISFDRIGFDPADVGEIGVAFNVTDTREVWSFWPRLATLEDPGSWAPARVAVGAR